MNRFPSEASLELARELDVSFFLVEEEKLWEVIEESTVPWDSPEELYAAAEALGLEERAVFDDVHVFTSSDKK